MYDMTIRLRTDSCLCLYEQIYEHIKKEIRDGKLLAGERLPSTRSLAEYLQIARSTVDCAYGQLLDEGYIEAKPYRGYFVCPMEGLVQLERGLGVGAAEQGSAETWREKERRDIWKGESTAEKERWDTWKGDSAAEKVQRNTWEGTAERGNLQEQDAPSAGYEYDFSPYDIDMSGFPFSVWKKITRNILSDANSELFSRGQAQGDYALRETISRYLHSSRGVNCKPEQIIVGAGNDYLLMLLEKILGRHVRIAMESPTYIRSYRLFQSFAYPVVTVGMDESGMCAEELETADVGAAYVMPSHQFPVGTVMPIRRRLELLKWADGGENRYLIEDDYDSEFRFHGKPIPALQATDEHGKVIYIGTFSKAIAPAIRVSFMVLPEKLLKKYLQDCSFYSCTVSRIDQSILNEFIRDGYFERHLNKMRKIYRAKHDLLLELLQPFQKRFSVSGENAGLHVLLTAKDAVSEQTLIRQAAEKGVKVYGMSSCMVEEKEGPAAILLGFGGMTEEQISEGVKRLWETWM